MVLQQDLISPEKSFWVIQQDRGNRYNRGNRGNRAEIMRKVPLENKEI